MPLGMFPLGAVLFPGMELSLHVFEPRYRALTVDCLRSGRQFGVVLIERGHEVGGGDTRFTVGTVARIVAEAEFPDGRWGLVTRGTRRIRVATWLPDDPYPVALVQSLDEGPLTGPALDAVAAAERVVRRALALASELDLAGAPPAGFVLDADPAAAAWQLCSAAPLGPLDRQRLLEAEGHAARLELLVGLAGDACELFARRLSGR